MNSPFKFFALLAVIAMMNSHCVSSSNSLIGKQLEKNCQNNDKCIIDMSYLIPFEWDSLLVFGMAPSYELVFQSIPKGTEYDSSYITSIYFMNDGFVVHSEFALAQWDEPLNRTVTFDINSDKKQIWFPSNDKFVVRKYKVKGGFCYGLEPTE